MKTSSNIDRMSDYVSDCQHVRMERQDGAYQKYYDEAMELVRFDDVIDIFVTDFYCHYDFLLDQLKNGDCSQLIRLMNLSLEIWLIRKTKELADQADESIEEEIE